MINACKIASAERVSSEWADLLLRHKVQRGC